jgi:hypothetical protein
VAEQGLDEAIRDNAQGPAKAQGDAGSVQQHPLRDQVEADRYLESKKATRRKGLGVKFVRLEAPGAA